MAEAIKERRRDRVAWDAPRLASPHAQPDKAQRVRRMFDAIAPTYELVNSLTCAGRDRYWRREMARLACVRPGETLLDIACGTGDVARTFAAAAVRPERITGLDFSRPMLALATARPIAGGAFCQGDALRLPLADASVSIATCAFGIRNFQHLDTGLREMHRVLRPGGRAVILEFSLPRNAVLRGLYLFYINRILPLAAAVISGDRSGAYRYLPRSVVSFSGSDEIAAALMAAGFSDVTCHPRTLGIVSVYVALKDADPAAARR